MNQEQNQDDNNSTDMKNTDMIKENLQNYNQLQMNDSIFSKSQQNDDQFKSNSNYDEKDSVFKSDSKSDFNLSDHNQENDFKVSQFKTEFETNELKQRQKKQIQKQFNIISNIVQENANPEEIFEASLQSAVEFNKQLLHNKKLNKELMKKLQKEKQSQRFSLDSNNGHFQSTNIPLYLYDDQNKVYFDSNNSFHVGKTNIENFINLNLQHENSMSHLNSYQNGGLHIKRFQRRRRRRRNAMGVLEERPIG